MDLAEVFGRGNIERQLEQSFQKAVIKPLTMTPIYDGGKIELGTGVSSTLSWKNNP